MGWQAYEIDRIAQELVLKYRDKDVLDESHKMRLAVAYGLERFWGEHLRLRGETKGEYWKDVWDSLVDKILHPANIPLPNEPVNIENTIQLENMAKELWKFSRENPNEQRIALAVLTQLCDSLVWWTQRYKTKKTSR